MRSYPLGPGRMWVVAAFGRSPLIRFCDRIEALIIVVGIVATLVTVPIACGAGTAVYTRGYQQYAWEARTRHAVTVTATDAGAAAANSDTVIVQVRWDTAAGPRTAVFESRSPVKAGQRLEVWLDNDGRQVDPPTPTSRAAVDGVIVAAMLELIVSITVGLLVAALRFSLDRRREAQWEHELRSLMDDNGGRSSKQS